jgi:glycerol-3-phosphate acyltransferase PlsX
MDVTIAIDCMGGDFGPSVTLPAVFRFLQRDDQARVILVGLPGEVEEAVA